MECQASPCSTKFTRKRKRNPEKWKRNQAKISRYSPKELPTRPECNHNTKSFQCCKLTMGDIFKFHESFYKFKDKLKQDALLIKYCKAKDVKRRRPQNEKNKKKTFQTKFTVWSKSQKKSLPVCQKAFLNILHITKHRVQHILKQHKKTGATPIETRGGDHKSHLFKPKKEAIIKFVNLFQVSEAHYCRGHSQRQYLPAELSINKIFKMYNEQAEQPLKVKKGYFRKVFNNNYALGFGSPRTDVCSTCLQFTEKIKTENDACERNKLIIAQRVHKLKSKAFYDLIKEQSPTLKTFSFDCEKNMPLPKVPDQRTYYSRQIYLYNLTIVEGSSKSKLSQQNVYAYCWSEDEHSKGSNEIASAVYHRLLNTDFTGINTVRLVADGCAGQNKNSIVLAMCSKWLIENAPEQVKTIELVFPVAGHSFIPPDRVFAQIEKDVRKREVLVDPGEYIDIIKERSTVIRLGTECSVMNWKQAMTNILKDVGSWHFQFKKAKRYFLKRSKDGVNVLLKGDINYKMSDGVFKKINRKNKTVKMINPKEVLIHMTKIKTKKLTDVENLLITHYGNNWAAVEKLRFYKNLFSRIEAGNISLIEGANNTEDLPENDNILCEYLEDDSLNLRI